MKLKSFENTGESLLLIFEEGNKKAYLEIFTSVGKTTLNVWENKKLLLSDSGAFPEMVELMYTVNVGEAVWKTARKEGELKYWESPDLSYSLNKDIWGELADKPIRHREFPSGSDYDLDNVPNPPLNPEE